jgi:hypothetical protein
MGEVLTFTAAIQVPVGVLPAPRAEETKIDETKSREGSVA